MEEEGVLEKLKSRLYKKGETFSDRKKDFAFYGDKITQPPSYWNDSNNNKKSFMKKSFWIFISVLISIAAIVSGVALYFYFSDSNLISSRNIDIEIKGPVYIDAGKPTNISFSIRNKNQAALEFADLIVEFPDDVFSYDGASLGRERFSLNAINPGDNVNKSIDAVFFGMENDERKISVSLEYRLAGSNAILTKNKDYTIKISKPAVGVSVSAPKEIPTRQEIEVKVEVVSNSESIIRNLSLQMTYPSGFHFSGAEPKQVKGDNLWFFGDLDPSQKKNLIIKGVIEGQDLEEKAFNAVVGVFDESGEIRPYGGSAQILAVKKSPLHLSVLVNEKDSDKNIARANEPIRMELNWINNLPSVVRDAVIEVSLTGDAYREDSFNVSKGAYRASDKKIIWNSSTFPELVSIKPGQTGRATFSFSTKDFLPIVDMNDKNFFVDIEAKISGLSVSDENANAEIFDIVSKEIKIASPLDAKSVSLHYSGPFKNSGPMPPKVGVETMYTIVWSLGGNSNDLSNVKVSASLPPYIHWMNVISPSGTDIKYDERDGSLIWNVGYIYAGAGVILPPKEAVFQVGLTPSYDQKGQSPILASEARVEAFDSFTGENINTILPSLDTALNDDPKFDYKEGKVVE